MKLYFHFQGNPELTKIIRVEDPNSSLASIISKFVSLYNAHYDGHHCILESSIRLFDTNDKHLSEKLLISEALQDLDDVFVRLAAEGTTRLHNIRLPHSPDEHVSSAYACKSLSAREIPEGKCEEGDEAKSIENQTEIQALQKAEANLFTSTWTFLHAHAKKAIDEKNHRKALEIYNKVLALEPSHLETLTAVARLWLAAGRGERALEVARLAASLHGSTGWEMQELMADCLRETGEINEALELYQAAAIQLRSSSGGCSSSAGAALRRLTVSAGRVLAEADDDELREMAGPLVADLIRQDQEDFGIMELYAKVALPRGLFSDVVSVCLRLLVQQPKHPGVSATLAHALTDPAGMEALHSQLGTKGNRQAAMVYLANRVKECGAVAPCISLFRSAVELEPTNAAYVLNLIHAYELIQDFDNVVATAQSYGKTILPHQNMLGGGCCSSEVLSSLDNLPPLKNLATNAWLMAEPWDPGMAAILSEPAATLKQQHDKVPYTSDQLDTLALLFTVVKVLYVGGALSAAARLSAAIEPARTASKAELHTTLIRNEAAYQGCVIALLRDYPPPPPLPLTDNAPPLFVCGDSHCLSGAWRIVEIQGVRRLLVPLLVTGLKIWHMRAAGTFYPKMQLQNSLALLPRGAQVIMLFGEIDCREGLLLAVQKLKYDSLEDGMRALLDVYATQLRSMVVEQGLEVWVHPPPPVLNETRSVVTQFEKMLRKKVPEVARKIGGTPSRLHYLNFFDELLRPDGRLKPELAFDGTHLAPTYLKYLQEAFNRSTK